MVGKMYGLTSIWMYVRVKMTIENIVELLGWEVGQIIAMECKGLSKQAKWNEFSHDSKDKYKMYDDYRYMKCKYSQKGLNKKMFVKIQKM